MEEPEGFEFKIIKEGRVIHKVPAKEGIFYNPVQEFNRDLTIVVINVYFKMFGEELIAIKKKLQKQTNPIPTNSNYRKDNFNSFFSKFDSQIIKPPHVIPKLVDRLPTDFVVLEALAATGLRSLRYALEIDQAKYIISNDLQPTAVQTIAYNISINNLTEKVICTQMEASQLMSMLSIPICDRIEVIDLDPYGSAANFIDASIKAIADGGLLCVTCTDVATLCGNNTDACFYKYGSFSTKAPFCHEMALRIVLNCIESVACRYQRYIIPLISVSVDFYVRIFVRIQTSAEEAKRSSLKRSYIFSCNNCHSFKHYPLGYLSNNNNTVKPNKIPSNNETSCPNCECIMKMSGPIYSNPIYDIDFVKSCIEYNHINNEMFKTSRRINGVLTAVSEELPNALFYYSVSDCFSLFRCPTAPIAEIMCDLIRNGRQVSKTHAKRNSLKTDATSEEFWDTVRAWVKTKSTNPDGTNIKNLHAKTIFNKPIKNPHNFEIDHSILPKIKAKITRYQLNPAPYWGPLSKNKVGVVGIDSNRKKKMED